MFAIRDSGSRDGMQHYYAPAKIIIGFAKKVRWAGVTIPSGNSLMSDRDCAH
jgi:hypothetical protein